jgi:hypothetical protein
LGSWHRPQGHKGRCLLHTRELVAGWFGKNPLLTIVYQPVARTCAEHPSSPLVVRYPQLSDLGEKFVFPQFSTQELVFQFVKLLFRFGKMHHSHLKSLPQASTRAL